MRAITLTQPWAGLVAAGIKLLENRRRPIIARELYGKPVAIHSSRQIDPAVWPALIAMEPRLALDHPESLTKRDGLFELMHTTSCVLAVGTPIGTLLGETDPRFGDCALDDPRYRRWYFGPVAHLFRDDMRRLPEPVACRGKLGCWTLPPHVAEKVAEQLARAA